MSRPVFGVDVPEGRNHYVKHVDTHDVLEGPGLAWQAEKMPGYVAWRESEHGKTVYRLVSALSRSMAQRRDRWGMFGVINVARWEHAISGKDDEGFKISNTWEPYLARELTFAGIVPEGFFELVGGTPDYFIDWCRR